MIKKEEDWYFDTVQLIKLHAEKVGISSAFINTQCNLCTMCDYRFFSHRRQQVLRNTLENQMDGFNAGRQITIAQLN